MTSVEQDFKDWRRLRWIAIRNRLFSTTLVTHEAKRKEVVAVKEVWCLLLLLRIRSAHLEILGFSMGGAYQYRYIVTQLKRYGERRTKQVILV